MVSLSARPGRIQWWIALAVAAVFLAVSILFQMRLPSQAIDYPNFWFDGDLDRVSATIVRRLADQYRSSVHPLFPTLLATPAIILSAFIGAKAATMIVLGAGSGLLGGAFYLVAAHAGGRIADALLLSLLLLVSAAFLFWGTVPETYGFGGASLMTPLAAMAVGAGELSFVTAVLMSAFSLGITMTNWMAGLVVAALSFPPRIAMRIAIYGFALVAAVTVAQGVFFPTQGKLLDVANERWFVSRAPVSWISKPAVLLTKTVSLPSVRVIAITNPRPGPALTTQYLDFKGAQPLGLIGMVAWLGLLIPAMLLFVRTALDAWRDRAFGDARRRLHLAVGLLVLGQIGLHSLYGTEVFMYSLDYTPLLIALVAFLLRTRLRPAALALIVIVIVAGGIANVRDLNGAHAFARTLPPTPNSF